MSPWLGRVFDEVSAWLSSQADWIQNLLVGLILLAVPACGVGVWKGFSWVSKKVRRAPLAPSAEFESFPADLGIVDHGVNTDAALQESMRLLRSVAPAVGRIFNELFKDAPNRLPPKDDPSSTVKKQIVMRASAKALREDVLLLEDVAAKIKPQAAALIAAYRAILGLPVSSAADIQKLKEMKSVFAGTVIAIQQCAGLLRARSQDIARLNGMQQDLTRVVQRTVMALSQIAAAADSIAGFYSDEMPKTIDRLLESHAAIE